MMINLNRNLAPSTPRRFFSLSLFIVNIRYFSL